MATLIVSGIVVSAATLAVRSILKDKRNGRHPACGCGCKHCPHAKLCKKDISTNSNN